MSTLKQPWIRLTALSLPIMSVCSCGYSPFSSVPDFPKPAQLTSTVIRAIDGFVPLPERIVSIGRLASGDRAGISFRSVRRVELLLIDSSGRIVDAARTSDTCSFVVERPDEYFLFFVEIVARGSGMLLSLDVDRRHTLPARPAQYIVVDFNGADQVELFNREPITDLSPTDLTEFGSTPEERDFLMSVEQVVRDLIIERLRTIFERFGIRVVGSEQDLDGIPVSTVYYTNAKGPPSADTFETVRPETAGSETPCDGCILYGEAGRDPGNQIPDDDAVVYVGSFVGNPVDTSINDMVNLLAHAGAHEIGHLLGLQHVRRRSDIMWGRFSIAFTRNLTFESAQVVLEGQLLEFLFQEPQAYLRRVAGPHP